jgi:hypothetical protein
MGRRWSSVLIAAIAAAVLGCMSPTLPLPPPAQPSEAAGADPGTVNLHGQQGSVPAGSTVIIYNLYQTPPETLDDTQKVTAVLAHADGSWDATIFAIKGDNVSVYDIEEGEWSPSINVQITVN